VAKVLKKVDSAPALKRVLRSALRAFKRR